MSNDLNREELNQLATEKGIENPESYGTKADLQAAIDELETPNEEVPEEQTSLVDDEPEQEATPEEAEPEPEQEAEDLDEDAVAPSQPEEAGNGAELDGTVENETPQNAFDSRSEAVKIGQETAQENIEKERAENQVDGE